MRRVVCLPSTVEKGAAALPALTSDGLLAQLSRRVHAPANSATKKDTSDPAAFDVLWLPKREAGSPLDAHLATVRRTPHGPERGRAGGDAWRYAPEETLAATLSDPHRLGERFTPWSRACAEMAARGRELLTEIHRTRSGGPAGEQVRRAPVTIGQDRIGDICARARAGANAGRSTKSTLPCCTAPSWLAVRDEFGLRGVAAYPNFAMGSWWMGLLSDDYGDWRQAYLPLLDYAFYLEYNVDTARPGPAGGNDLMHEVLALWDMPGLPAELQARRLHVACDMAFFDLKRRHEASLRTHPTDGLTTWVHTDRDDWRDFKAVDSGIFAHYLSFAQGPAGRDDMMLTGLVNDWVDLGPDLRHEECGQGVLALTRGSLVLTDLLDCYERTVWMINAQLTPDAGVRPERYAGCMETLGTCVWQMCNHRQDLWRYYALAHDLCDRAAARDLYTAGQLAECYTPALEPRTPSPGERVCVPRRELEYAVRVGGELHRGTLMVHHAVRAAVEDGLLPMSAVEYALVVPLLLRDRRITEGVFLRHMDGGYCDHFASVMHASHASGFSRAYGTAVAALVMEQWWHGIWFAIGAGSLIEAQPDRIAADRDYGPSGSRA